MTDQQPPRVLFPLAAGAVAQADAQTLAYLPADRSAEGFATALTRTIATEPLHEAAQVVASATAQAWFALARLEALLESSGAVTTTAEPPGDRALIAQLDQQLVDQVRSAHLRIAELERDLRIEPLLRARFPRALNRVLAAQSVGEAVAPLGTGMQYAVKLRRVARNELRDASPHASDVAPTLLAYLGLARLEAVLAEEAGS
ncbi:MAG: hypothetical protein ABI859_08150 [Pseudomonadota bacterium]